MSEPLPPGIKVYAVAVRHGFTCASHQAPGTEYERYYVRWWWPDTVGITAEGAIVCDICAREMKLTEVRFCRRCREPRPLDQFPEPYDTPDTDWMWGHTRYQSHICETCRHPEPSTVPCEHCGETFAQRRSDARFCSGRCRVAAHRQRQSG